MSDVTGASASRERDPAMQMKQPNLAELVAGHLRARILAGEFNDGDVLPKQDDLLATFPVSRPSLREALRVLEAEGLITVRRGKFGGAVVHLPTPDSVARTLSSVLNSRAVALGDLAQALALIEPMCAGMCAERPDRHQQVLPVLRDHDQRFTDALESGDLNQAVSASRRFHEEIVRLCGNETLIVLASAVEAIWSDQYRGWAEETQGSDIWPDRSARQAAADDHRELLACIDHGDSERAVTVAREHLLSVQRYPMAEEAGIRAVQFTQVSSRGPAAPSW